MMRPHAVSALSGKGFDVAWSLAEPSDAWAIVTVTTPVTEEVLNKHPKCKLVAVSFTGFNHVDLEACKKRGISVVNVPAYSTDSVAELSVGLALAVYREIPAGERTLRDGGWVHSAGGMEIRDKVVGIVGLGDIGLRTAELFKAFGPKEILGWSRRPKPAFDSLGKQVPIEELFEKADIVSLHVALNAETQGIINRSLMERLRPESVLINVARGGVCDQPALADLLSKKRFRAGLESPASGNSCLPLRASMLCFFVLFVGFFLLFCGGGVVVSVKTNILRTNSRIVTIIQEMRASLPCAIVIQDSKHVKSMACVTLKSRFRRRLNDAGDIS
ncbi:unnamed protein product [Effrenium voratum]|uniref:D-isomer specific 2-hydroxyacid dehydrogenase NAD-binding domain-containing protein n=1 Tax=Effrenium voratum TaxID=2562239 RepID=A0AA36N347_9DINO|nr:unnamed protein product [Effrenium voratum]